MVGKIPPPWSNTPIQIFPVPNFGIFDKCPQKLRQCHYNYTIVLTKPQRVHSYGGYNIICTCNSNEAMLCFVFLLAFKFAFSIRKKTCAQKNTSNIQMARTNCTKIAQNKNKIHKM